MSTTSRVLFEGDKIVKVGSHCRQSNRLHVDVTTE